MSLEIIRRKEGEMSQKQDIRHENTQFSINSYGHLSIREFDKPYYRWCCEMGCIENTDKCTGKDENGNYDCHACEHYKNLLIQPAEHLIVLDKTTTDNLIKFIFENRSTYELRELLKGIVKDQLPF
ncbi:MAG: hypothetical protein ACM3TR_09665 [Caulobacteraceae bacterium]